MDTPFTFPCGLQVPNRICKPAMSEQLASRDGCPSDDMVNLYRQWGQLGGAGLLITGNVMVDHRRLTEPRNAILESDIFLDKFKQVAQAAKSNGTRAIMQISHPGRVATLPMLSPPLGPSEVGLKEIPLASLRTPRALTVEEIEDIVRRFARTAELAIKAGFDGVQIHGAHGYLVSQFLSPLANVRTDAYGGDAKRRMKFLLDIVQEVRKVMGQTKMLSVKLNSADFQQGGFSQEDSLDVICELEKHGVDLLEISGGNYESPAMTGIVKPSTQKREAYFVEFAAEVRKRSKIPLMLSGGVRTLDFANQVITDGEVDVLGIARPFVLAVDAGNRLRTRKTLADLPQLQRTKVTILDAFLSVSWYTLLIGEISKGQAPNTSSLNPWIAIVRVMSTMSFRMATQFRENDWKWAVVLIAVITYFVRRAVL